MTTSIQDDVVNYLNKVTKLRLTPVTEDVRAIKLVPGNGYDNEYKTVLCVHLNRIVSDHLDKRHKITSLETLALETVGDAIDLTEKSAGLS